MRLLILSIIVLLTGCGQPYWQQSYDQRRNDEVLRLGEEAKTQASQTPNRRNYDQGEKDGCASGNNATGDYTSKFTKNVDMYIGNQYYKSGWDDGFARCKGQGEMINGVINSTVR